MLVGDAAQQRSPTFCFIERGFIYLFIFSFSKLIFGVGGRGWCWVEGLLTFLEFKNTA